MASIPQVEIMEQTLLIELIRTLQREEREHVLQFATLSYFNDGRMKAHLIPLLELCFDHFEDSTNQTLGKDKVYALIFPGQEFVEGKLEKVIVEAHKVIRAMLLTHHYFRNENEFNQALDYSEVIRQRGLDTRYQQLLSKLQKAQKANFGKNTTCFHQQFRLEYAIYEYECLNNHTRGDLNTYNTLHALEMHFYLNRLALLNHFLLQRKMVANLIVPEGIKTILKENFVSSKLLVNYPLLKISFSIFNLLKKDSPVPSDVRALFELLQLHETNLDQESLRKFYTYLRNLCVLVSHVFFDNEEIRLTLFDLYKHNLERNYLLYEGKLHRSTYLAVSLSAVRVKQFDWAYEFIEKFKNQIFGQNEEQDIYRFNMALYLFGIEKYSECLDFIPSTSPFLDYLINGKRLELKVLYELNSELLPYKLDAFKMFLSRTSQKLLSETMRQINVDFANLLTQITNSTPGDPKRSDLLIKRIQEKKQAAEWRWLLEKAKALKNI